MRLDAVDVLGFGGLREQRIEFDAERVNLVLAPNETGKSTLLAAIEAALFGFPQRRTAEGRDAREQYTPWAGGPTRVALTLRDDRHAYVIDFEIRDAAGEWIEQVTVRRDGCDVTDEMVKVADSPGRWLLGLSRADFRRSILVRQGEIDAVAQHIEEMVRELEQVVTSSDETASAAEAVRRLGEALDDYRAGAGLTDLAGDVLARARSWARVEARLEERLATLGREQADLERSRADLAEDVAALERLDAEIDRLDRARERLAIVHDEVERRQLERQLDRDGQVEADLSRLDEMIASHDDVAGLPLDQAGGLAGLAATEEQQRRRLDEARAAHADAARELEDDRRRLETLADAGALADGLDTLREELGLFRRSAEEGRALEQEVEAERRRLADAGVPLADLESARARQEAMDASERARVREHARRRLELEGDRRRAEELAREAGAAAKAIETRRRQRRGWGLGLVAAGVVLGAAAALLARALAGAAPGTAAVLAAGILIVLALPGVWLVASTARLETEALDAARARAGSARDAAAKTRRAVDDLDAALAALARRLDSSSTALLAEADLIDAHRGAVERYDRLRERLAETRSAFDEHRAEWRERLAAGGRAVAEDDVTVAETASLVERAAGYRAISERIAAEEARLGAARRTIETLRCDLDATHERLRALLALGGVSPDPRPAEPAHEGEPPSPAPSSGTPIPAEALEDAVRRFETLVTRARARAEAVRERSIKTRQRLDEAELTRIRRRVEALRERRDAALGRVGDAAAALAELRTLEAGLPDDEPFATWTLDTLLPEHARAAQERLERRAGERRERLSSEGRHVREFLRHLGERRPETEREMAHLSAELARGRAFAEAVDLARRALQAAQMDSYGRWSGLLTSELRDLLGHLLPNYRLEGVGRDLSFTLVHEPTGQRLTTAQVDRHLSRGAKDRFFLAVRIAIARALGSARATPLPLLLDDPLAHCDDERFADGMRLFASLPEENVSVLLFSCQRSRCEEVLHADEATRRGLAVHALSPPAPPTITTAAPPPAPSPAPA